MLVFPLGNPRLDIIAAAGTPIPEGTNAPVIVNLPVGSSTNQIVRVQARGFDSDVAIRVKITPENAPSATFDGTILQSSGSPPFADVQVTLRVDTVCHIHAWISYLPSDQPGRWRRTPPHFRPPEMPQWRFLKPFAMTNNAQFRPPPPPALDSALFEGDLNEVKRLGGKDENERTADQTLIARFWSDFSYTVATRGV